MTPATLATAPAAAPTLRSRIRGARERVLVLSRALEWLPPLVTRVVVGLVFVWSGWGKLHNLDQVTEFFRSIGIPAPELQAPFAAANEFLCGLLLVAGLFTRCASIPLMVIMVVALKSTVYEPAKAAEIGRFNYVFGLPEFLYIVALLWLAVYGAGAASLDRLLFRARARG